MLYSTENNITIGYFVCWKQLQDKLIILMRIALEKRKNLWHTHRIVISIFISIRFTFSKNHFYVHRFWSCSPDFPDFRTSEIECFPIKEHTTQRIHVFRPWRLWSFLPVEYFCVIRTKCKMFSEMEKEWHFCVKFWHTFKSETIF